MIVWSDHGRIVRAVCALTLLAAVVVPIGVTTAADNATLKGFLAYETRPAEGWRAVFVASNHEEFISSPADADGAYSMEVPVGMRYTLVAGVDPSGERHAITNPVPQWVRVHGVYTIPGVVDFRDQPVAGEEEEDDDPEAVKPPKKSKPGMSSKKKKILGYSLGAAAVVVTVVVVSDSDDDPPVSPSNP